jgi:DNA adenine methylase
MNTKINNKPGSVIRWFGGKALQSKGIISRFPEHHCYVEPFSGGAHVMMNKIPSKVEIFNDIDEDLVNFLMILRENKDKLIEALITLPSSRHLCMKWQCEPLPSDPFEKAVRWFYLLRQTIIPANNIKSGWRTGKVKNTAIDYQNVLQRLSAFELRFRRIMIECLDFRECILRYDTPKTMFFVDPPYVDREDLYKGGFTENDHIELSKILNNVSGKVLLSYYADPLILELYKGWRIHTVRAHVGSVLKVGQNKKVETEYYFMNYDPPTYLW